MTQQQQTSGNLFFSVTTRKQRLVFWAGAILIGCLIVWLTLLSEWASDLFRELYAKYQWRGFIAAPFGLALTAWITMRFFRVRKAVGFHR